MAGKRLAIIIAILFMITVFPASSLAADVTLILSADSAWAGDSICASGTADANTLVCVKVMKNARTIVIFDAVKSDSNGNYICAFKVPPGLTGNLTIVAGYGSNVASRILTVLAEDAIAVTDVSLNKTRTIIVQGGSETMLATVAPANATNQALSWSSDNEAVAAVDGNGLVMGVAPGTAAIKVKTTDGNKEASCAVTVTKPETASDGVPIAITADTPVTITVPSGVISTITVTQNTELPLVEVISDQVDMTISPGTQVEGYDSIQLPVVKDRASVDVSAAQEVDLVIEIGSDLGTITFSKPVRLVLKGQGTHSAGFIDNNEQFQIIRKLASLKGLASEADADAAALALDNAGVNHGAAVSGSDLIIWTRHFTEFIAYTTSEIYEPIIFPEEIIEEEIIDDTGETITSNGGTLCEAGVTVRIPALAVSSDIKVSIKKLTSSSIPTIPPELQLVSKAFEISKDKDGDFAKAVTVTLPFDKSKIDKEKQEVAIYCWKANQWTLLQNVKVDMTAAKVKGDIYHFGKFAVLAKARGVTAEKSPLSPVLEPITAMFSDISRHWAEANIKQLLAAGAISGNPDGRFYPDNYITRAEFASILVKSFKLTPKDSGKMFNDTAIHWAKDNINTVVAYGIASGYDETTFGPNDLITREQMAVMLVKACKCSDQGGRTFADSNQITDWARAAVAAASAKNILGGYPDNTFKPRAYATRAEAVTAVVKAMR